MNDLGAFVRVKILQENNPMIWGVFGGDNHKQAFGWITRARVKGIWIFGTFQHALRTRGGTEGTWDECLLCAQKMWIDNLDKLRRESHFSEFIYTYI